MNFSFHNKLNFKINNKDYVFYNSLYSSFLTKLSNLESFNNYISIGNGIANDEQQNAYHLSNPISTIPLTHSSFQSDISKGSLYATYQYKFNKIDSSINHITEVGLSDNSDNPTIYNYFNLISTETHNGVDISNSDEIVFEITIYLVIDENNEIMLTSGNNPFIEFLLGNGFGNVYICSGSNYSTNVRMDRSVPQNKELYLCTKTSGIINNTLTLSFECILNIGELDEIIFVSNGEVFARKNVKEINNIETQEITVSPKANYVIKISDDIKTINSVTNQTNQSAETNYFVSKYANSFGDNVKLPFNNIFSSTTSRFLSKDAKLIFFILDSKVYGYKNENFGFKELNTKAITSNYIQNIISFDKYVFVISKTTPFISTYIIDNLELNEVNNNFSSHEKYSEIENALQLDITQCNNNKFLLGLITSTKNALTIYFDYSITNGFETASLLTNNKEFDKILAMYKNNFCDGRMLYLKDGKYSIQTRLVTHFADATEQDVYTSLAYNLVNNSKNIYCHNRALIAEKNNSPSLVIFYYPQMYQYELSLISNELKDYISTDLNYLIQKLENNEYKIYNLVGYDTPEEFSDGLSNLVDTSKIVDFEFMNDTLLIFLNDDAYPIVAYNLNLNKTQIENVSSTESEYKINLSKYNKIGKNNSVKINFIAGITLWYFLIKFTKSTVAQTCHFMQKMPTHFHCFYLIKH